jgi:hypothetical protein
MRCLDAILPGAILLAGLGFMAGERPASAQIAPPTPQVPQQPSMPGTTRPGAGTEGEDANRDPMMRQLAEQQAHKRADIRQKLIVDDTAKLLNLAQQLKEQADKGTIDKSSSAFARKAEEIERLAKTVKDKMREGQ